MDDHFPAVKPSSEGGDPQRNSEQFQSHDLVVSSRFEAGYHFLRWQQMGPKDLPVNENDDAQMRFSASSVAKTYARVLNGSASKASIRQCRTKGFFATTIVPVEAQDTHCHCATISGRKSAATLPCPCGEKSTSSPTIACPPACRLCPALSNRLERWPRR